MDNAARDRLARLAGALRARVKLDACRDPVIHGRRGNTHADGTGYSIVVMLATARQ